MGGDSRVSVVPAVLSLVLGEDEVKTIIALIPARAGSQRIPGKNIKPLAGHPLIAYTIAAAKQSGIFTQVICSTESGRIANVAETYGAYVVMRPKIYATDDSPDIEWVRDVLTRIPERPDAFAILRPTSPFRTAATIQRAWHQFKDTHGDIDSIRAVEPWTGQHPGKIWTYCPTTVRLHPVMREWTAHAPYHSSPTQSLIPVFKQNASLEMAWRDVIDREPPTIGGDEIAPFWTEAAEGFDVNTPEDWALAEEKIVSGEWTLPPI